METARFGREREIREIVQAKRAAAAGRMLLGELNGPLEPIVSDGFREWPRPKIRQQRDLIRSELKGEIASFCTKNFEGLTESKLAALFQAVFEHNSSFRIPLSDFQRQYGRPKEGVLHGAPLHATICISPWGLQTEYPERRLSNDLDEAVRGIVEYRTKLGDAEVSSGNWRKRKSAVIRDELAKVFNRYYFYCRMGLITAFNLVEAYLNGLAWEYVQEQGTSDLSEKNRQVLTEEDRPVNLVDKLVRIPRLIKRAPEGPLHDSRDPLKTFLQVVKPFRDAAVHASPFSAPERFGGYDKLEKIYGLNATVALLGIGVTVDLISEVHKFVGGEGNAPVWLNVRVDRGDV